MSGVRIPYRPFKHNKEKDLWLDRFEQERLRTTQALLPMEELANHAKRAYRSSQRREAWRARTARPERPSAIQAFVQISLRRFEFRLGAGIIGSPKNRSNPMQIINFHLGAGITGASGHFDVSLEAPSYYGWAPA
jgi:hypothetical protein